jgi:hypothetical protein
VAGRDKKLSKFSKLGKFKVVFLSCKPKIINGLYDKLFAVWEIICNSVAKKNNK